MNFELRFCKYMTIFCPNKRFYSSSQNIIRLKHFIFTTAFFLCFLDAAAQDNGRKKKVLHYQAHDEKAIHFGFCLGLNVMDFTIAHSLENFQKDSLLANVTNLSMGFHIQAVSAARITDFLEFRFLPGVAFGQRELSFYRNNVLYERPQTLESSYIELPVMLKYKSKRVNNYRAFLVGGWNPRFDLAKTYREDDGIYMDLKLNDLCYELGGGFDFYFPYFKLSIELRGSWGIFNVLNRRSTPYPEFQNAIASLRSSAYMISFYIE